MPLSDDDARRLLKQEFARRFANPQSTAAQALIAEHAGYVDAADFSLDVDEDGALVVRMSGDDRIESLAVEMQEAGAQAQRALRGRGDRSGGP